MTIFGDYAAYDDYEDYNDYHGGDRGGEACNESLLVHVREKTLFCQRYGTIPRLVPGLFPFKTIIQFKMRGLCSVAGKNVSMF